LEKQSETAKIYLKYKEELKKLEVALFLKEYDKIHTSKEEIENKLSIVTEDLDRTKTEYEKIKKNIKGWNFSWKNWIPALIRIEHHITIIL
jgi:hypothetical protein